MSQSLSQQLQRSRFNKLTLKRNKAFDKVEKRPSVIVIDESFDVSNSEMHKKINPPQVVFSPIIINDSSELSKSNTLHEKTRTPSKSGNASFNNSKTNQSPNANPSDEGWSPTQNIITATPRTPTIPSTPKDKANESLEQCSLKKIEMSHKKLLDELYGNVWKSIPKLFKEKEQKEYGQVQKKLDFFDDEDKENIRQDLAENKKLYLTDSNPKHKSKPYDVEGRSKKKLYTEKIPSTPDPVHKPKIRRAVQTTTKKIKGKSVTEIVELMKDKFVIEKKKIEEDNVKRLSFVGSLADNVPTWRCHIEAINFIDNFKTLKEALARKLFVDFNTNIFNNGLDADMPVLWDTKLRSTAGTTTNRLIKTSSGDKIRSSSIKLSTKVVDGPQRLRDTLVHEMCHAATWVIDEELKAGHGPLWKRWAKKALKVYPELGEISRCHNMEIHFKYTYKCTKCGYKIQRHSKSIDLTKKCCGYCHGKFEIILNKKNKDGVVVSTPARQGAMNDFAQFVKENYGAEKQGKTHAQVMKVLGEQFSAKKKVL